MITSRNLYVEEPRDKYDVGKCYKEAPPSPAVEPTAKVIVNRHKEFGSVWATLKLSAVDIETGEIIKESESRLQSWIPKNSAEETGRVARFIDEVRNEGYIVCT
ncbi:MULTISPECIES: hypothetical protein [Bacillus]|uniref:hypothetical protein n=1 Tax=Bacillus TaxID=1386 RepID=UPI00037471B9|nr:MULTISPECIES: hypothetical protein [Bacillus]